MEAYRVTVVALTVKGEDDAAKIRYEGVGIYDVRASGFDDAAKSAVELATANPTYQDVVSGNDLKVVSIKCLTKPKDL